MGHTPLTGGLTGWTRAGESDRDRGLQDEPADGPQSENGEDANSRSTEWPRTSSIPARSDDDVAVILFHDYEDADRDAGEMVAEKREETGTCGGDSGGGLRSKGGRALRVVRASGVLPALQAAKEPEGLKVDISLCCGNMQKEDRQ